MGKARTCCHVCAVISALLAVFVGVALTKIPSSHPIIPLPLPSVALNAVGDVLGLLGVDPAPVDYHSMVLGAVKTAGGLSDLDVSPYTGGRDDHALEMLRVLCDDLTRAADSGQLTLLGKLTAQDMIQRSLVNRLQIVETLRLHGDAIMTQRIVKPVIVVGLPRSGTSAMVNVLAEHASLGALPLYQTQLVAGVDGVLLTPDVLRSLGPVDPRVAHVDTIVSRAKLFLSKSMQAIHHISAENAEECTMLFCNSFVRSTFGSMFNVSAFESTLFELDHFPAYLFYKRQLQLLQWQRSQPEDVFWLLKSPNHMAYLHELTTMFPDARIVWMHRHPAKVVASMCSMMAHLMSTTARDVDAEQIGRIVMQRYSDFASRAVAFRREFEAAAKKKRVGGSNVQIVDVLFDNFVAEPVETACGALKQLGEECHPKDVDRMARRMSSSYRKNKHGKHRYSLSSFGVTEDAVQQSFSSQLRLQQQVEEQLAARV